jgi:CHASE3 domain sensor protein
MEKLRTVLKWRWIRALRIWNRLPIRAQGGITVFIPIVAVIVSFGFAIYGNQSRAAIQSDVQRKFKAVRQYSDLLTLMIDAETGERGFLLTGRDEFLEPYGKANAEIPNTIAQLKETIEAEPGEKPRLERIEGLSNIRELIDRQLAQLKQSQSFTRNNVSSEALYEHLQHGKSLMDEIRNSISVMQNKEETLLNERIEEINSIRNRDYIVIFITLLIGMLVRVVSFYLFDRGIVRRINRLTEYTGAIIKGEPTNFTASKKTDAVGLLEERIVELSERIENGFSTAKIKDG